MRVLLLHNPVAGDGDAGLKRLLALLGAHGHAVRCRSTKEPGWKKALRRAGELIVVAGGDGTVAKVLRRLDEDAPPVAILPCGSANNIARGLGIDGDLQAWIGHWPHAPVHCFERPLVRVGRRRRRFVEAVGLGVFASVIADPQADSARGEDKVQLGTGLLLDALRRAPARRWRVEIDGSEVDCPDAIMLEALNVPLIGPRLPLSAMAPGAGPLDIAIVPAAGRGQLIERLAAGGELQRVPLSLRRARHVVLHPAGSPLHVDDVLWPKRAGRHAAVEIVTGGAAVRVLRAN